MRLRTTCLVLLLCSSPAWSQQAPEATAPPAPRPGAPTLVEVEYTGQSLPPGTEIVTRRPRAILGIGIASFVLGYLTAGGMGFINLIGCSLGGGTGSCTWAWWFVPIAGPWVSLGYAAGWAEGTGAKDLFTIFGAVTGLVQAGGVAAILYGVLRTRRFALVEATTALSPDPSVRWSVVPMFSPSVAGLAVGGEF